MEFTKTYSNIFLVNGVEWHLFIYKYGITISSNDGYKVHMIYPESGPPIFEDGISYGKKGTETTSVFKTDESALYISIDHPDEPTAFLELETRYIRIKTNIPYIVAKTLLDLGNG